MGQRLLCFENIQALCQQRLASQILLLAVAGDLFGIFGNHLGAVDDIDNKLVFHVILQFVWCEKRDLAIRQSLNSQ